MQLRRPGRIQRRPRPRLCLFRLVAYLTLAVCIIGLSSLTANPNAGQGEQVHRLMKNLDVSLRQVHSFVQYDQIKQRFQDSKDTIQFEKQQKERMEEDLRLAKARLAED